MKPIFSVTDKMLNLMVEITEKITRLEIQQERNLHLRKENRIRSIQSSLAIEKNSLSLEQVTDIINGKKVLGAPQEIHEVQNAYEAYQRVFQLNPFSIDDFLKAHQLMTKDLVKESGEFRSRDVGVYDGEGNVVHIGARPPFVYSLIKELFEWAENTDIPELIKSCVVHFEIEMIHPFADGNGRMGRLWQNLILVTWQQVFEWIPIETIVYQHQEQYYETLTLGDKENDATKFIEFMLAVILETIEEFQQQEVGNRDLPELKVDISNQLNKKEQLFLQQIYPFLKENREITNKKATELSHLFPGTTRRYLQKLVELKVLKAVGVNKGRKYVLIKSAFKKDSLN